MVYLCISRPDVSHTIGIVSQIVAAPHSDYDITLLLILRYLHEAITCCLVFSATSCLELYTYSYSDADWAGDPYARKSMQKSTTGYCVLLGDSLIV